MTPTVRTRESEDRAATVAEYEAEGYAVVSRSATTTRLRYRDHGTRKAHLLVFVLAGLWTAGLANLAYALYRRHTTTDVVEVAGR